MMEPIDCQRATYAWRYWGLAVGLLFSIMMALALSHVTGKAIANLAHFNTHFDGGTQ